ncbi:MAG: hypothetical protein Q8N81_02290, partial [bacterium]|nr:hypothetical protein [bacterium]
MSKKVWIWIVVILVAILVIWKLPSLLGKNLGGLGLTSPTPSPTPSSSYVPGKKTAPTAGLTYDQTLAAYADKRIQFNEKCQGIPGQMVLKKGTKIMLDNRSKYVQTINLDGAKVVLPAYSWQIVTVTTKNQLPYNFGIDCKSEG